MKAYIGTVLAQVPDFLSADLPFGVHLAFSYDEEVGCFGARGLLADLQLLELEPQFGAIDAEVGARQPQQRRAPHVASDALARGEDVGAGEQGHRGPVVVRGEG
jgi:putative aminopeptidase FrvX